MSTVVLLYAAALASTTVWVASAFLVNRAVGARVTELQLGPLPLRLTRVIRGVTVKLTPSPSASLSLLGRAPDDRDDSPASWRRLGLARRLIATLAPWLPSFAIAMALLGPARALRSAGHAFAQAVLVVDPTPLVRAFVHLVDTAPAAILFGVVCAKLVAFNLLPFANLAGGAAITEVARSVRGERTPSTAWMLLGVLGSLYVLARFAYAFARVLL